MSENIVIQPFDAAGNFVNQIVVYNTEQETKTYFSLIQGARGRDAYLDIGILEEVIRSILKSDNSLRGIDGVSVNQQDVISYLLNYE